ncbi:transposase [Streptomyces sp. NPDC056227]|uniref:transposase n=1 Tax=Streptomyces sp. NPDC056227 TaxID=3345753 RepID=UPI0035E06889
MRSATWSRAGSPGGRCPRTSLDWDRVYAFFRCWREHGLFAEFHDRLRGRVREREGREAEPTAGIIDAQSVKAAANVPAASRGFDGGKLINGRKRHIVTDCLGLLLVVAVTAASLRTACTRGEP